MIGPYRRRPLAEHERHVDRLADVRVGDRVPRRLRDRLILERPGGPTVEGGERRGAEVALVLVVRLGDVDVDAVEGVAADRPLEERREDRLREDGLVVRVEERDGWVGGRSAVEDPDLRRWSGRSFARAPHAAVAACACSRVGRVRIARAHERDLHRDRRRRGGALVGRGHCRGAAETPWREKARSDPDRPDLPLVNRKLRCDRDAGVRGGELLRRNRRRGAEDDGERHGGRRDGEKLRPVRPHRAVRERRWRNERRERCIRRGSAAAVSHDAAAVFAARLLRERPGPRATARRESKCDQENERHERARKKALHSTLHAQTRFHRGCKHPFARKKS